jgi:hypothetical protein
LLSSGQTWLQEVTAPASRSHPVLSLSLPGIDIGADASPAMAREVGYIELWVYPHDADDYHPLIRVLGAPALPLVEPVSVPASPAPIQPPLTPQPERLPGELWT